MNKYLIIRFSSFGDIAQALPCATSIRQHDPSAEIHWLTRSDFVEFVKSCQDVDFVWGLNRKHGLSGLRTIAQEMKDHGFTHIYDAHSNLRSFLVSLLLRLTFRPIQFIQRPKERFRRILLFWFRTNTFPKPFRGIHSFQKPLEKWFKNLTFPPPLELATDPKLLSLPAGFPITEAIVLAPSATWEMKRWPTEYWGELAQKLKTTSFVLLAGENDEFCDKIVELSPLNILNLRGKVSWLQSTHIISLAKATISGDTGLLHVADVMGKPAIAIIGPTAFGFPSRKSTAVAEIPLSCRPCTKDGRGGCRNKEYKKCLKDISPQMLINLLKELPAE